MFFRPPDWVCLTARVAAVWLVAWAASPALAVKLLFLQNPVSPPIRVSVQAVSGRQLEGSLTAYASGGFVLQPRQGAARDVRWSELAAPDVYELDAKLIGRRPGDRPEDWFNLGRRLHRRGGDQDRRYAEMAFRRSIEAKAGMAARVRAYLEATRQAERSIEANRAGSAAKAAVSQSEPADSGVSSLDTLATPLVFRATTRDGDRIAGRLVASDGRRLAYEGRDRVRHELAWAELSAADVFALHAKLIGLKDRRRDAQASSDDWEALAALLDGLPGAEAERKAQRARELASRLDAREDLRLKAVGIDPDRLDDEVEAMDAAAVPTSSDVDPAKIPDSFTGRWDVEHEPHEIHRRLRDTFAFGVYQTDDPANFHDPRMLADREPDVWSEDDPMHFEPRGLYPDWWNRHNTTGRVLGAMGTRSTDRLVYDLRRYLQVLVEGDPEVAVPVAEAYLRVCGDTSLPDAIELLAAAYRRAGQSGKLNLLIRQGVDYRPVTHRLAPSIAGLAPLRDAAVQSNDFDGLCRNVRAALLRCDGVALDRWLSRVNALSLDAPQQRKLDELYRRSLRLSDGLAASLKRDEQRAGLEAAFDRVIEGRRADNAGLTLVDRLEPLSTAEAVLDLQRHLRVFGAASSPTADRLLYLMEQRQWSGLELSARALYPIAFHIHKHYEPARVVAVYALVQKVGCLRPPQKKTFGGDFFAAAECGIYIQRCFEDNEALLERDDAWDMLRPVIALAAEMCNDESAAATGVWGHKYSWMHRFMANSALFRFDKLYDHVGYSEPMLQQIVDNYPPRYARYDARFHLASHLMDDPNRHNEAIRHIELMIEGHDSLETIDNGVRQMQRMAIKLNRIDLWNRSIELGQITLIRHQNNPEAHDIDDLRRVLKRPIPPSLSTNLSK